VVLIVANEESVEESKNTNRNLYGNDIDDTIQPKIQTVIPCLVVKGKPKKVAIVACMRKMITILNTMFKKGEVWDEKLA